MPLRDDILNPIAGSNPAGENLRYAPIFDKIKEARREEEDVPQGDWSRERKVADWPLVIKLASEALATKSKDLQIAVWLAEALLRREGMAGLKQGLELIRSLLEQFWDDLYPEIEDGDAELRATPLEWIATRLERPLKNAPLTRNGLNWYQYRESRVLGYEADANTEDKLAARQTAIQEGKITGELFDSAFDATPKAFYATLVETYDSTLEVIESLSGFCDEKFGDVSPSFGTLRQFLEELRHTAYMLLQKKREKEPDEAPAGDGWGMPEEAPAAEEPVAAGYAAAAPARARAAAPKGALAAEPESVADAASRLAGVARYLRQQDNYTPAPYLLLRGFRWGELRASGDTPDAALLAAPPTEVRQEIKRLATEGQWAEVLEAAETAMAADYGRAWLDLQRYVCRACYELGSYYDNIAKAVRSELRTLLADLPQLPEMTLADDTATANAETLAWIKSEVQVAAPPSSSGFAPPPAMEDDGQQPEAGAGERVPDAYELAMQAVQNRQPLEGIEILAKEISNERSGRARFQRKVQLAQLCLTCGHEAVAYPVLVELSSEIERRRLEDWEPADVIAHALVLLYRCILHMEGVPEDEKRKLYARICCLDPVQALSCGS